VMASHFLDVESTNSWGGGMEGNIEKGGRHVPRGLKFQKVTYSMVGRTQVGWGWMSLEWGNGDCSVLGFSQRGGGG